MRASILALALLIPCSLGAMAEGSLSYPRLQSLGPEDPLFRQHQEAVAAAYLADGSGGTAPDLVLYEYKTPIGVDLFALAARLSLPYESLATLNRLDRSRAFLGGEILLVPSAPGLFVPERPSSDLEFLLSYRRSAHSMRIATLSGTRVFFPNARFTPEERSLFLGNLFRLPLPAGVMTSGFGERVSPVTGKPGIHQGVDLAAPAGTEVYAAREGTVTYSGVDAVLGEHVIVAHKGGWSTVYGHLSQRAVRLNDSVASGMIIGRVGSTGLSTGPHLHFEVRIRGEARDPESLVPRMKS
ncbi:MAG: M23 family metallopeptidase [Spirochaetota bacterium]